MLNATTVNVDHRQHSLIADCFDFARENEVNRVFVSSISKLKRVD